jgi:hypothetical protein
VIKSYRSINLETIENLKLIDEDLREFDTNAIRLNPQIKSENINKEAFKDRGCLRSCCFIF